MAIHTLLIIMADAAHRASNGRWHCFLGSLSTSWYRLTIMEAKGSWSTTYIDCNRDAHRLPIGMCLFLSKKAISEAIKLECTIV